MSGEKLTTKFDEEP